MSSGGANEGAAGATVLVQGGGRAGGDGVSKQGAAARCHCSCQRGLTTHCSLVDEFCNFICR